MDEVLSDGKSAGWPEHVGEPRHDTSSDGGLERCGIADNFNALALSVLDGDDERSMPWLLAIGYHDTSTRDALSAAARHSADIEMKQTERLEKQTVKRCSRFRRRWFFAVLRDGVDHYCGDYNRAT